MAVVIAGEAGGEVADRNAGGRQDTAVVLRVLVHQLARAAPAETGDQRDVARVRAALEVEVGQERIQELRLRLELVGDGEIERLVHRKVPAGGAKALRLEGEA